MATAVKTASRDYHARVAAEFKKWLKENPKATRRKKVKAFDEIADRLKGL